jgi:hypothetical protein
MKNPDFSPRNTYQRVHTVRNTQKKKNLKQDGQDEQDEENGQKMLPQWFSS